VLRKSSALDLDELGHASAGPALELEKELDVGALIDIPGTATQSSIPSSLTCFYMKRACMLEGENYTKGKEVQREQF
jgi:hypothetical protein